jgi:hypothetical protein
MTLEQKILELTAPTERGLKDWIAVHIKEGWHRMSKPYLKWKRGIKGADGKWEREPEFVYCQAMSQIEVINE